MRATQSEAILYVHTHPCMHCTDYLYGDGSAQSEEPVLGLQVSPCSFVNRWPAVVATAASLRTVF